jgi:beta-glucosidase
MVGKLEFPEDFLWGSATSSYQIEGAVDVDGRGPSIWDTFCATPGKVANGDTGAVACDHYHRYIEDIDLMREIGLDAYRFSIAWPRILPQGRGKVNGAGLDFYDQLVDHLLASDIQPWATLYHWDLPQPLEDAGGWPNRDIVDAFVEYADVVTRRLGDRVRHWMTLNEPWVFTFLGYGIGIHAPGRADMNAYLYAAHHALLAHARATPVIRANGDSLTQVGIAFNMSHTEPATDSEEDRRAAMLADQFVNGWFADPVYRGTYPTAILDAVGDMMPDFPAEDMAEMAAARPDFMGINSYFRTVVRHEPELAPLYYYPVEITGGEITKMGWEVYPDGLYELLVQMTDRYDPGAIYITENGAAYDDTPVEGVVNDPKRLAYFQGHLAAAHRAIQAGAPLKGYFAWSLMDNFEWAEGYDRRFGLVYVDFDTQKRLIKDSGRWYGRTIHHNGFVPNGDDA